MREGHKGHDVSRSYQVKREMMLYHIVSFSSDQSQDTVAENSIDAGVNAGRKLTPFQRLKTDPPARATFTARGR